jgi:UDP-N-acetylglucosamine--dolichyl-phosphate N-acetylglucosaminephosphotransferase
MFNFTSLSTIQYLAIIGNLLLPIILVTISMPYFIKKFTESGVLGRDYYKKGVVKIPESGGIVILLITLLSISFTSLFFKYSTTNYVVLIVICLFGIFGILDDMIDIGRVSKLFLMYYCSYPLIQYATSTALVLPSVGHIELGILYLQFIVPTYVLVASNLVNMHSGYNGLASGLSAIVLLSLIIKSIMLGDVENIFTIVAITGALLGYFLYDRFPSQIFWGNVGSLTIGATIGALIVIQGFIISGFIMLIPHTVKQDH